MNRVLVVDDREENRYFLSALFGGHGWAVDVAPNGLAALECARRTPPSIVVSDLLMPGMDGYTLLRQWKLDPRLQRIPFVVFTATYTTAEDEQLAHDLGADAFILKPAEPGDFFNRIRAVLARSGETHPRRPNHASLDEAGMLREYSETLVRKLEQKMLELEEANRKLQQDLVARERMEQALRESDARFRQLAENVDDFFWLADGQTLQLLYVSPGYERLWGRSCQSLYEKPDSFLDSIHPEDRERVRQAIPQKLKQTWEETYRLLRPDDTVRWVRVRTRPVKDSEGRTTRLAGIARDMTEYIRLEEQLRQSQKMEAVGRLAGGVAHDFNNLLSVILSYAYLIEKETHPQEPLRSEVAEIRRAGERAADLTRQLLAFGRQQLLQPRVVEVARILVDTEKMLRRLLGEDIQLTLDLGDPEGRVLADPGQLEQIVINLAVNARDAMPRGGRLILQTERVQLDAAFVASIPELRPGPYVLLTVSDTGTGMDAATKERIFEPFFTTKEQGRGTGLGLATVFGIVKQSRGHIEVDSEVGKGSTFRVYLPCTDAVSAVVEAPRIAPSLRGTETILLVEDDPQVRLMCRTVLRRSGYNVLDASDGSEALAVSKKFTPPIDLLVTDVVMPGMSGSEVADRLLAERPKLKVLYVSGYAENMTLPHGLPEQGKAFLQKPITPEALLRTMREVLGTPNALRGTDLGTETG